MKIFANPEHVARLMAVLKDLHYPYDVVPDPYCPAWTKPSWWRRLVLREKPKWLFYITQ